MIFEPTAIAGVVVVGPTPHADDRGSFTRTFCAREFADAGLMTSFVQANAARTTSAGTIRGMHMQLAPATEAKLVTCTRGAIFDVAVDVREGSPTFGQHVGVELTAENGLSLHVPEGCAHGYLSLVDDVETRYMVSAFYEPGRETGFRWDDPAFAIQWPIPVAIASEKDRSWAPWSTEQQEPQ